MLSRHKKKIVVKRLKIVCVENKTSRKQAEGKGSFRKTLLALSMESLKSSYLRCCYVEQEFLGVTQLRSASVC